MRNAVTLGLLRCPVEVRLNARVVLGLCYPCVLFCQDLVEAVRALLDGQTIPVSAMNDTAPPTAGAKADASAATADAQVLIAVAVVFAVAAFLWTNFLDPERTFS